MSAAPALRVNVGSRFRVMLIKCGTVIIYPGHYWALTTASTERYAPVMRGVRRHCPVQVRASAFPTKTHHASRNRPNNDWYPIGLAGCHFPSISVWQSTRLRIARLLMWLGDFILFLFLGMPPNSSIKRTGEASRLFHALGTIAHARITSCPSSRASCIAFTFSAP